MLECSERRTREWRVWEDNCFALLEFTTTLDSWGPGYRDGKLGPSHATAIGSWTHASSPAVEGHAAPTFSEYIPE